MNLHLSVGLQSMFVYRTDGNSIHVSADVISCNQFGCRPLQSQLWPQLTGCGHHGTQADVFADVITLSGGCRDVGDSKLETVSSGYTKDHSGASTFVALADGKTVGDPRTNGTGGSSRKSLLAIQKKYLHIF